MLILIAGLIIFLGVHSVAIAAPGWRNAMVTRIGEQPWKGLYSIIALVGLILVIYGYVVVRKQPIYLYVPPGYFRYIAMLLMLPVFPLLLATYLPGKIKTNVKNPMLVAVKAWALAHLLVNGMLADVLLFGSFLLWAVADTISIKKRPPKAIPALPAGRFNDVIAVVGGLLLYVLFVFWAHEWLVGVRPY